MTSNKEERRREDTLPFSLGLLHSDARVLQSAKSWHAGGSHNQERMNSGEKA